MFIRALIIPNGERMIRTREDFYQPGIPAIPGQHYRALVRFAREYAGPTVLDLGCGFGAYGGALKQEGLRCVGCDINLDYLRKAAANGIDRGERRFGSSVSRQVLRYGPDSSRFWSMSESGAILSEAFRVARKNVLITVPNSEDIEQMKANDVTYAHMLSSDHLHFFDPESFGPSEAVFK